jgi:hypothetical protein
MTYENMARKVWKSVCFPVFCFDPLEKFVNTLEGGDGMKEYGDLVDRDTKEDMGGDLIPAVRKECASAFYALFERQVDIKGTVIKKIETEGY